MRKGRVRIGKKGRRNEEREGEDKEACRKK